MASPYQNPDEDALTRILATLLSGGQSPEQLQEGVKHPQDPSRAGFGLQGASVGPEEKSSSEQTLAPGEWESLGPEGQRAHTLKQLFNMIQSAGLENMQGIGPHSPEPLAPPKGGRAFDAPSGLPQRAVLSDSAGFTKALQDAIAQSAPIAAKTTSLPTIAKTTSAVDPSTKIASNAGNHVKLNPERLAGYNLRNRAGAPLSNLREAVAEEVAGHGGSKRLRSGHQFPVATRPGGPKDTLKVKGQGRLPQGLEPPAATLHMSALASNPNIQKLLRQGDEIQVSPKLADHSPANFATRAGSGSSGDFSTQLRMNTLFNSPEFQQIMDQFEERARPTVWVPPSK